MMVTAIMNLKKELLPEEYSVVLCGDFNTMPEGCVYEYITTRTIDEERWEKALAEGAQNPDPKDRSDVGAGEAKGRGRGRGGRGRGRGGAKPVVSTNDTREKGEGKTFTLSHRLELQSAYNTYTADRGEPHFTNYTQDFKDALDYIFYSADSLRLLARMKLPSDEQLANLCSLPNEQFPSDHLPVMCRLCSLPTTRE